MRAVVQRVGACAVSVSGRETGRIAKGLLVYLGVGRDDTEKDLRLIVDKILHLRIFPDESSKMNLAVTEAGGGILVVSQFTLFGDCSKGRRPRKESGSSNNSKRSRPAGWPLSTMI